MSREAKPVIMCRDPFDRDGREIVIWIPRSWQVATRRPLVFWWLVRAAFRSLADSPRSWWPWWYRLARPSPTPQEGNDR